MTSNSTSLARIRITARCTQGQVNELIRWYLVMTDISGGLAKLATSLNIGSSPGAVKVAAHSSTAVRRDPIARYAAPPPCGQPTKFPVLEYWLTSPKFRFPETGVPPVETGAIA